MKNHRDGARWPFSTGTLNNVLEGDVGSTRFSPQCRGEFQVIEPKLEGGQTAPLLGRHAGLPFQVRSQQRDTRAASLVFPPTTPQLIALVPSPRAVCCERFPAASLPSPCPGSQPQAVDKTKTFSGHRGSLPPMPQALFSPLRNFPRVSVIPDRGSEEEQECEAALAAAALAIAGKAPLASGADCCCSKRCCANRTHFVRRPQGWQPLPPVCPVPSQGAARGDRPFDLLHSYFLQDEGKLKKGN